MSEPTALEIVLEQAGDEGLWFIAETAPEGYLQAALRCLHAAVEREAAEITALRELLTAYNLGGWTDSKRLLDERTAERSRAEKAEARAERLESMFWGSFERETCLRNDVRALRDLLSATMAQFVEYNSDRYAVVQMSNDLRDRIDAALAQEPSRQRDADDPGR